MLVLNSFSNDWHFSHVLHVSCDELDDTFNLDKYDEDLTDLTEFKTNQWNNAASNICNMQTRRK